MACGRVALGPVDRSSGVVPWSRRKRSLVDGEALDRGLLERPRESGDRIAVVEVGGVALAVVHGFRDVEPGRLARAGDCDVAPLLEPRVTGAEHEGAIDGDALGGMAGERVRVAHVAGIEIAPVERHAVAAVGEDDRARGARGRSPRPFPVFRS